MLAEQRRETIEEMALIEAERDERRRMMDWEITPKSCRDYTRESRGANPTRIPNQIEQPSPGQNGIPTTDQQTPQHQFSIFKKLTSDPQIGTPTATAQNKHNAIYKRMDELERQLKIARWVRTFSVDSPFTEAIQPTPSRRGQPCLNSRCMMGMVTLMSILPSTSP